MNSTPLRRLILVCALRAAMTHFTDERRKRPRKLSRTVAIWLMVVAVPGFIVTLVLNAFFLDDYDAYGEVPIPGSASLHLPPAR